MSNIIEIIRIETSDQGTIGVIRVNKITLGFTLSPPDELNKANVSNIPTGQYVVKPYSSVKYKDVYEISDVPGRTKILFHPGNTVNHTAGCILLGSSVGKLKGDRAILNSGRTFDNFRAILGQKNAHLTITENY